MNSVAKEGLKPLKILFLEDNPQDVELITFELKLAKVKFDPHHVFSKKDFLNALTNFQPDIILADFALPTFNGMHAYALFKEQNMRIPFILVTGSIEEEIALEFLSEGVDDIVLKSSFKRLPSVITRCIEAKNAEKEKEKISKELKNLQERSEKARIQEVLSKREYEILCLIASGMTMKEIADKLFLSPPTIATYRARILEKTDLRSNVELTRYALTNGLIV